MNAQENDRWGVVDFFASIIEGVFELFSALGS
jgi:hypothetical protein